MNKQILVVDDDPHIREVIGFALEQSGFSAEFADNGLTALEAFNVKPPSLMILDIGLPEMDGLEVCRNVRKTSELPILFLTARDDEIDRIIGFEIGGDDYLTKPFSPRELVARVKAILKRIPSEQPTTNDLLACGDLTLDVPRHVCRFAGQNVTLTASEFSLLQSLMAKPDMVLSRQQLTNAVYGNNIHVSDRTVDSHIRNIRAKLNDAGCHDGIVTLHGVGMRMGQCKAT